jgi:hypothetical protein
MERLCAKVKQSSERSNTQRMAEHVLAQLACLGTHTVTGLLNTCGHQFRDWSADYRLYGRDRMVPEQLFEPVRQWLCENQKGPIVMAMDDTRLKKTGRKVYGVKYMRDPMGPPFRVNFIRAQRFLQTSMACKGRNGQARMIPVDWVHAPIPPKPKSTASAKQREDYHAASNQCRVSAVGVRRIAHLRAWLNEHGAKERALWTVVDGSFTNKTVLKALPENTILVGRIRADAKLYHLPEQQPDKGRHRVYGKQAPTPEQLRQDQTIPWQRIEVFFGGAVRELRVKHVKMLRWRTAGEHHLLQLLVLAPTPYRLSKNSNALYRQPAYLICTDPDAALHDVIQHYLWRWDIEVNHRDEKTILGVGDAQVRTPKAVQNVTGCAVAAYAMLLTAAAQCQKDHARCDHLPAPKWQRKKSYRPTTMNLIQNLRYELWARSIHFSGFAVNKCANTKSQKCTLSPESALFYATRYA